MKFPEEFQNVQEIDSGKHGVVYKAIYQNKEVAIKVKNPKSHSQNTAILEAHYLEKVNLLGIGPKLILKTEDYVVMEFIDGERIDRFIQNASITDKKMVMQKVLEQMEKLDKAGINKMEMTNPYKHIIIKSNLEPVLIDFERARFNLKPQNISQFKEYLKKHSLDISE